MTPTIPEFRSRDLYFAAYLLAQGVPYVRTEWVGRSQAEFVFQPDDPHEQDQTEQYRRAWVNQTATCEAVRFANAIKLLKLEVHSQPAASDPLVERRRLR